MRYVEGAMRSGHGLLVVRRTDGYVARIAESGTPIESEPRPDIVSAMWHLDERLRERAVLSRRLNEAEDRGDTDEVYRLLHEHAERERLRIAQAMASDHAELVGGE